MFLEAALLPGPQLRSLDALHLATAIRLDADAVVAYDRRLLEAARSLGVNAVSP
jgi:predicted nucleic acid-binding protein